MAIKRGLKARASKISVAFIRACGARKGGNMAYRGHIHKAMVARSVVCKRCGKCEMRSSLAHREAKEIERTINAMRNA